MSQQPSLGDMKEMILQLDQENEQFPYQEEPACIVINNDVVLYSDLEVLSHGTSRFELVINGPDGRMAGSIASKHIKTAVFVPGHGV